MLTTMPRTILLATDFSSASDAAFEQACLWAQALHARLLLLHVLVESRRAPIGAETRDEERRHAEEKLLAMLDAQSSLQLDSRFIIREGAPAHEIVQCAGAEQADLVVVGTHGRTGVAHWALGSVAEKVVRNTSVPVMVVRMPSVAADDIAEADAEKEALEQKLTPSSPVDEGPAITLLERAVAARATDIHIDPLREDEVLVRFRIDGQLTRYCALSRDVADHLIQRFKLLGSLDIAEPFRAQEGRLTIPSSLRQTEVRVTCAPVTGGEAMALRVSSREDLVRPLTTLGLSAASLASVDSMLRNGEGVVLVTGPTGSGKTTTVYTMLAELASDARNIVSVEDPVEHEVPFVRQLAVDERHGITMTAGLKTVLRMDPDVIFIGEIRDAEAADIAMRAAASGKYVFSTLHSRDVASTITACRDLAITNHSLAGNLVGPWPRCAIAGVSPARMRALLRARVLGKSRRIRGHLLRRTIEGGRLQRRFGKHAAQHAPLVGRRKSLGPCPRHGARRRYGSRRSSCHVHVE
jgi:type II secretory ATPase GspE/PulE/Tfp pilus assembly ATPase PilB-like protein